MNENTAIIVVDDIAMTCKMISASLDSVGYSDVRIAMSAKEALAMIYERHADVVLADWIMPETDGLDLTGHIRKFDEDTHHYTSVILFTAKEGTEHLAHAFRQGVDDYLNKPINDMELAARVHAAARIATLQNQLLDTAIALKQNNHMLEELALTDPLTGLGNRRYLLSHLGPLLVETAKRGGLVCCAMIDVDNFKKINDEYGHDIGDEVLTTLAHRLQRATRPTDMLTRHGGEEFVIVLHYADPERYRADIFSRVLNSINQRPFKTSAGDLVITISIGVSSFSSGDPELSVDDMLKLADKKLYAAKQNGRNCVVA